MSDTEEKPNNTVDNGNYRDEKGRFTEGNRASPGRPKGISILSILRDQLGSFIDGSTITYAQEIVKQHLDDAIGGNALVREDIIDRIDGKATQSVNVKTDKLNELAESFKEIAKETDE